MGGEYSLFEPRCAILNKWNLPISYLFLPLVTLQHCKFSGSIALNVPLSLFSAIARHPGYTGSHECPESGKTNTSPFGQPSKELEHRICVLSSPCLSLRRILKLCTISCLCQDNMASSHFPLLLWSQLSPRYPNYASSVSALNEAREKPVLRAALQRAGSLDMFHSFLSPWQGSNEPGSSLCWCWDELAYGMGLCK
jgi:hypothetical protein